MIRTSTIRIIISILDIFFTEVFVKMGYWILFINYLEFFHHINSIITFFHILPTSTFMPVPLVGPVCPPLEGPGLALLQAAVLCLVRALNASWDLYCISLKKVLRDRAIRRSAILNRRTNKVISIELASHRIRRITRFNSNPSTTRKLSRVLKSVVAFHDYSLSAKNFMRVVVRKRWYLEPDLVLMVKINNENERRPFYVSLIFAITLFHDIRLTHEAKTDVEM